MSTFKDAQEFKAWKRKTHYKPVNEGFLDDDEDKAPIDSLTVGDTVEDKPDEEDAAELTGLEDPSEETYSDESDNKSEKPAKEQKNGVTDSNAEMLSSIKDMLSNLNTSIQTMNDTIAKQADKKEEEDSSADGDEFADLDLSDSDDSEDAGNDSGDDTGPDDNDSGDNSNDASDEGTEGADNSEDSDDSGDDAEDDKESDSDDNGKGDKEEESDEEYSGDDEHDDQKSEAYNQNMKRGGILNSNSHTIVGILESGKYWKLDDGLDTLVHLKLRERIEKAKTAFRQSMLERVLDDED